MSMDRRMVSILHYNGIYDPNKVEKFLGKNEDYYEVVIDGKIEKLKIPDFQHIEEGLQKKLGKIHKFEDVELPNIEHLETQIKKLDKNIEKLEKLESFTNNLEEVVENIKKSESESFTITRVTTKIEDVSFEDELKKSEIENQEFLESVAKKEVPKPKAKKVTKPKTKSTKKETIESKKNIDDDINDFIDTI